MPFTRTSCNECFDTMEASIRIWCPALRKKAIEIRGIEQVRQEIMSFFERLKTGLPPSGAPTLSTCPLLMRKYNHDEESAPISSRTSDGVTQRQNEKELPSALDHATQSPSLADETAYAGEQKKNSAVRTSPRSRGELSSMLFAISRSQRCPHWREVSPCHGRAPRGSRLRIRNLDIRTMASTGHGLLAQSAIDALHLIDVVTHGAAGSVIAARTGLDGGGERLGDRLAKLARDAALLAIGQMV